MGIIKIEKRENPFAQIDKTPINDDQLSWKAKGILLYLISKPEDWQTTISDLKKRSTDGRESTSSGVKELIEKGYINRERSFKEDGKFDGYDYIVSELPVFKEEFNDNGKHVNGKHVNVKSVNVKPATTNNDITNKDSTNSDISIPPIDCLKNENAFNFKLGNLTLEDYPLQPVLDSEDTEAIKLCKYARFTIWFYRQLCKTINHYDHIQNANLKDWMKHIRLMAENDNVSWELMKKIAKFALTDSFWSDKILSTSNFRDKVKKGTLRQAYERKIMGLKNEENHDKKESRTEQFARRSKGILD